jgi:hypothetical protein
MLRSGLSGALLHRLQENVSIMQVPKHVLDALQERHGAVHVHGARRLRRLQRVSQLLGRDPHGVHPVGKIEASGARNRSLERVGALDDSIREDLRPSSPAREGAPCASCAREAA